MNGYLLDTHVLLWWLSEPERLSQEARSAIADGTREVFFSAAGAWEMAIKRTLGRLDFPANLADVLRGERIEVLRIGLDHALGVADLPLHHQDPFDRVQIAQARIENLTIITRDPQIVAYDVPIISA